MRTPAFAWRRPKDSRYSSTDSRLSKLGITFPRTEVRNHEACFVYNDNNLMIKSTSKAICTSVYLIKTSIQDIRSNKIYLTLPRVPTPSLPSKLRHEIVES